MAQTHPINIDIWIWALDDASEANRLKGLLSPGEIAQSRSFHKPDDCIAFINRRGRMREILAARLDRNPAELQFQHGSGGKPALQSGPEFNVTHSDQKALLAVSDTEPLGVDIEAVRPLSSDLREMFTDTEWAYLNELPETKRPVALFRMWTCKEALSKALDIGVWLSADTFSIHWANDAPKVTRMLGDEASAWSLINLETQCGMPSTLAVRANGRPVRLSQRDQIPQLFSD